MKSTILPLIALLLALPLARAQESKPVEAKAPDSLSTEKKEAKPADESPIPRLVELRLDENVVPARALNIALPGKTKTLQEVLDRFEEWSKDEKVGAILLDVGLVTLSTPDVEELRLGVKRLRDGGKKVVAFLNGPSPSGYLLACSASEIAMPPTGAVMLPGIGALFPFMKGYYQTRGVEYDVITAGRYKYPGFVNEREPNDYFLEEYNAILDSWIDDYYQIIAEGRNLTPGTVKEIVNVAVFNANEALQRGLVDTLAYQDEHRDQILRREKMRRQRPEEDGLAEVNSIQDLIEMINSSMQKAEEARKAVGPKIAVLHARGPIIDINLGVGLASSVICRDDFVKVVDELRRNDSIKAVVMRVDSPGGSGYASDVIWRKLRELDEAKPLVVSMGRVAGSGGYYIACPARRIFAHPSTITGSIGVLGIFQSSRSMFNRMDYELAAMGRGDRALLGAPHRELNKGDRDFIQTYMNNFYDVFIDRVAVTRKMPAGQVRKIAEGRIYTGRQAVDIGLIDELGGLKEAIASARELAGIPPSAEYRIVHYPRPGSLGEIFESFSGAGVERAIQALAGAVNPAPTVSFDDQLAMFARTFQPLCWMATPLLDAWSPPLAEPSNSPPHGNSKLELRLTAPGR